MPTGTVLGTAFGCTIGKLGGLEGFWRFSQQELRLHRFFQEAFRARKWYFSTNAEARHLERSNKPSSLVMMMLRDLREGKPVKERSRVSSHPIETEYRFSNAIHDI